MLVNEAGELTIIENNPRQCSYVSYDLNANYKNLHVPVTYKTLFRRSTQNMLVLLWPLKFINVKFSKPDIHICINQIFSIFVSDAS